MKESRYVFRLAHEGVHTPAASAVLLSKVRERVRPLGGEAMNLRVSRRAIEFDLFCSPEAELARFFSALEPVGTVLTSKRLGLPPGLPDAARIIAEARNLFNEERYWEAHETLEDLWKIKQGQEKQLLQGLILTAAALVHAQKGQRTVVGPMLEDAARRLENQPPVYYGLDVSGFSSHVKKLMAAETLHFPTI